MTDTEKPPSIKPRRPVPPRPNQTQLAKLGLVENDTGESVHLDQSEKNELIFQLI